MSRKTPKIHRFSQAVRFLRVTRLLLWTIWVIYRERRRVIRAHEKGNYEVQPNIEVLIKVLVAFRETAIKLGVLMIKLGQFLSSRADLLPEQALAVLISLQDEVPAEPFIHVISVIEEELGKPIDQIFSYVESKATAAASLGQVHKAVLVSTGEEVAVKVQRPNIDQLVRMDLNSLKFVIRVITRFVNTGNFIDLKGVYREFERTVYEEIDFVSEAANCNRFKEMFKDDQTIYIPDVYEEYTTRRLLVLEWIDGIKINDYTALEAAGIDRLEGANPSALERGLSLLLEQFYGLTLGEAREMDIPEVADEIGKLLYGQPFQIPAQFTFVGRAISTLVGVSTGLAPDFNFIDVAAPYARKFLGLNTEDIGRTIQQLLSQLLETINTLLKMPRTIERILTKLEAGQFVINLGGDIGIGATAFRRRENNGTNTAFPIALALMFIACLGAAAFFLYDHDHVLAFAALVLAAFLGLRLFFRW